tara:strand:- start:56 stop:244 length:189 start_codon:yes stop_codon:yes gene_type:complete
VDKEVFKKFRNDIGVSQQQMAEILGYKDKSIICKYETGERTINPRLEKLIMNEMEKRNVSNA